MAAVTGFPFALATPFTVARPLAVWRQQRRFSCANGQESS